MNEGKRYVSGIPRRCTNCGRRIKIGMTYYIPLGASILCSDCFWDRKIGNLNNELMRKESDKK